VLAVSASFWCAAALLAGPRNPLGDALVAVALLLGAAAPAAIVFAVLARREARAARIRLHRRLLTPLGVRWIHCAGLLLPAVIVGAVALVAWAAAVFPLPQFRAPPFASFPLLALLVLVPVSEELAWRGFALERLLARIDGLRASLLLAGVAVLWQLPLFLIPGTPQAALGFGTPAAALLLVSVLPQTLVLTALYCATGGSVLATILMHLAMDLTAACVELDQDGGLLALALWFLLAVALLARYGPDTLSAASLARWRKAPDRRPPAPRRLDAVLTRLARDPTLSP
jgi:membrane protease YdiL (CAAX protease family)